MDARHMFLQYASLTVLTLQTTLTVLMMRYSRMEHHDAAANVTETNGDAKAGKDMYIASTLVLVSEIIKLGLCLCMLLIQKGFSLQDTFKCISSEIIMKPNETGKLAIPSTLYTVQNNLIILALSYLDAATYQVTYQLKILTTAFFSVLLLKKQLRILQWGALVILMVGVILVQFPAEEKSESEESFLVLNNPYRTAGLLAIVVSSLSSGFAGVYYEKLLKESAQPSVVIRNIQLGIFSILFGAIGVAVSDWNRVASKGFFHGYNSLVWTVVLLQASGGLLVAAVIKYADNILKGFATSVSIVLSCLYSYVVFHDLTLDSHFLLGTGLVIGATFLYGIQSHNNNSTAKSAVVECKQVVDLKED